MAADGECFFYVPDVVMVPNAARTLRGIDLYIGDGATITRSMVRSRDGLLIGHAPVVAQLAWCAKAGVRCAFAHQAIEQQQLRDQLEAHLCCGTMEHVIVAHPRYRVYPTKRARCVGHHDNIGHIKEAFAVCCHAKSDCELKYKRRKQFSLLNYQ